MPSTCFRRMLIQPQPHPEEARRAVSIARGNPRAVVGYTIVVAHHSAEFTPRDRDAAWSLPRGYSRGAAPQDEVACESAFNESEC